ncbi:hypothetical protein LTR53_008138 [Teratosphaeriaceae sp. CCFEE 6253]|nr:hypothetical protein LTR53_008138 [Teratosphaeriaceae sp. CCFEE 6253]
MWLFITLTQVQIMLALLSAAFPGLKQTLQDLVTCDASASDSRSCSKHNGSFALRKMHSERNAAQISFPGSTTKSTRMSNSKMEDHGAGDGDSQDGIIRQDEFEVRYDIDGTSDREPEGLPRSW